MSPLTTPPVACLSRPSLAAPFPPTKLVSQRQRLSLLFGGQNWLNSLIHYSRYALGWFEEKDDMHQDDLKIRDEFMLFFKIASAARNWIHFVPQTAVTTFAFSSVFILLLCPAVLRCLTWWWRDRVSARQRWRSASCRSLRGTETTRPTHNQLISFFVCFWLRDISPLLGIFTVFVATASTSNPWMVTHPSANHGPNCLPSVFLQGNWCFQLGIAVANCHRLILTKTNSFLWNNILLKG